MQSPEGPEEDGDEFGPPLPPDDRLWRHPSEMGSAARSTATAPSAPARRREVHWGAALVAGLAGAAAAIGVVIAAGGFDDRVIEHDVVERVAAAPAVTLPIGVSNGSANLRGVAAIAEGIEPAIARLEVRTPTSDDAVGTVTTTGSAVLFRDDGYLLTTADLVADSVAVSVILADGDVRDGQLVGLDPLTDVAVVKIDGEQLPTALLGSVADLEIGEPTITIGSPGSAGGGPAVTAGIVSALGSTVRATTMGLPARHDMIQTDAPLAPSSAGGALLDSRGAVVGITTAVPEGGTSTGLSFATPIDTARAVAADIIASGSAHHPWLGIEGSDIGATAADDLHLDGGARVATVTAGSPAEQAGLNPGDVITSVAGVPVTSMAELVVELRRHDPGETVILTYVRGGVSTSCTAALAERSG